MRCLFGLGVFTLLMAGALGCAPSIHMVHQSNTFFEYCHRADYDSAVTPDQRQGCWSAWLEHYTLGQSPERLAYARTRMDGGDGLVPLPGISASQVGSSYTASYLAMSAQDVEVREDDRPTTPRDEERLPSAPDPSHQCSDVCVPHWDACIRRCDEPYGGCRSACEVEHRTCLRGCF